jgi:hypothetical protein
MGAKGKTARPARPPAIMPAIIPLAACRPALREALRRSSAVNRATCSFFFSPIFSLSLLSLSSLLFICGLSCSPLFLLACLVLVMLMVVLVL